MKTKIFLATITFLFIFLSTFLYVSANFVNIQGISYNSYTGEKINGTATYLTFPFEEEKMVTTDITNGEWFLQGEYGNSTNAFIVVVNDSNKIGYSYFVVKRDVAKPTCSNVNMKLKLFFFDIYKGVVESEARMEIEGTQYKNIKLNSGENYMQLCLIRGKIYKINIYSSGNGKYSFLYPVR